MSNHSYDTEEVRTPLAQDDGCCETDSTDIVALRHALGRLPSGAEVNASARIFAALGDSTRLKILSALAIEELCVCDLTVISGVSQSAVSHQLRLLRRLDLVAFRREGKRAVYRLADEHVRTLLEVGFDHAREAGR